MKLSGEFNINEGKTTVLVAPLDWGLGHATRCIPIISELIKRGFKVIIAASNETEILLKEEFPNLEFILLNGYRIKYVKSKGWFWLGMMLQLPKLFLAVKKENKWLKRQIKKLAVDLVISDNRLGLYTKEVPCIYITHQLAIKTFHFLADKALQKMHYHFINKYSQCWVPDFSGDINFSGELSRPDKKPAIPVHYIGILSRFEKKETAIEFDIAIVLSGPEPQRSLLEETLLNQIRSIKQSIVFIRGLPGATPPVADTNSHILFYNHLPSSKLNEIILQSALIICRSGYTSIMDLLKLQKKAILIPTPGQTEQAYLAKYQKENHHFYTLEQKGFEINLALNSIKQFSFLNTEIDTNGYKTIVHDEVNKLLCR